MAAPKGHKFATGRPKGSANKSAARIAEDIVAAYQQLGGIEYLVKIAREDHKTFCALLAKILPTNIQADVGVDLKGFTVTLVSTSKKDD